jgi:hypothetical protein
MERDKASEDGARRGEKSSITNHNNIDFYVLSLARSLGRNKTPKKTADRDPGRIVSFGAYQESIRYNGKLMTHFELDRKAESGSRVENFHPGGCSASEELLTGSEEA